MLFVMVLVLNLLSVYVYTFSDLTLLVGYRCGTGMVICLERDADLHTAQLMPLPLTVSCFSKIQIDFTFLVPAHPGSPGKRAVKRVCVRACVACVRACGWVSGRASGLCDD